jgi:hypothetical protein
MLLIQQVVTYITEKQSEIRGSRLIILIHVRNSINKITDKNGLRNRLVGERAARF